MEEFKNMMHQVSLIYQKLTKRQRIVIIVSIVVVIAFLVFLALYKGSSSAGANTGYAVLVQDIGAGDAAAIVARLEKDGIKYHIENEKTILVPQEDLHRQRMMIASEGLIKDRSTGFELFDNQQFGATSKEMDVKFQRAIEGELARTISALEPIEKAVVHIAFPKDSVFTERQVPPTASVAVSIRQGLRLSRKQIDGIKNIVSAAVPKLTLDNIKIVDQKGMPLDQQELYENEVRAEEERYRKNRVAELEEKIIRNLAPYANGKTDNVYATVEIQFDFSKVETQSEIYDPNTVIRSKQTLHEESQGRKAPVIQGVPGAVSNIGPVEGLDGPSPLEWSLKDQVTVNNEVGKTVTNKKVSFPKIVNVSATASIPKRYREIKDESGKVIGGEYVSSTPAEMAEVEKIVRGIINFDATRGDKVAVAEYEPKLYDESKAGNFYDRYVSPLLPSLKYLIAAILLFIFYKKVIAPFTQKMLADYETTDEQLAEETQPVEDTEDMLDKLKRAREQAEKQLGLTDGIDEDALQYDILIEKLKALVNDKTEEVANVLQSLVESDTPSESKDI